MALQVLVHVMTIVGYFLTVVLICVPRVLVLDPTPLQIAEEEEHQQEVAIPM